MGADWIAVADQPPPHDEPVVYARPNPRRPGNWHVGIAYWTVSQKWNPEAESQHAPEGFTHWKPLGEQPRTRGVMEAPAPQRPECLKFALGFLGDREATEIRQYIDALEAAASVPGAVPTQPHRDLARLVAEIVNMVQTRHNPHAAVAKLLLTHGVIASRGGRS